MLNAEVEGLLDVNRDFRMTQTVQMQPIASDGQFHEVAHIPIAEALIG